MCVKPETSAASIYEQYLVVVDPVTEGADGDLGELLVQVQVVLGLRLGSGICKWTVVTSITSSGGSGARSTEHYRFL